VDVAAKPCHELACRFCRSTCREQVVDDQNLLSGLHRVVVDFERVAAVLEVVARAHRRRWQLSWFAYGRETDAKTIGDGRSENEPAALDANDEIDPLACKW
jgi:hypothetical protein